MRSMRRRRSSPEPGRPAQGRRRQRGLRPHLTKRGWIVTAIVAVVILGGGTWFLLSALDDSETTVTPEVEGTGGFVDPPEEEEWGEAHFRFTIEVEGGEHLNEYFIAEGTEGELLTQATDCVDAHLQEDYYGVSCYAFDSEDALEFAEPDVETGAMENLCWRAYYSDSEKAEEGTGAKAGAQYEEEGCP